MITVNGNQSEWEEGLTVKELLARENYTFRMISVWINDQPVEKKEYPTRLIPDGANVQVIHNISGG
ncbi:MAG: sulfur carrier protein ThiS [Synergistaceae bacterium]|nr:sulfur carrier protein ThiS [Synergistaceae bacterium]